MPTRSFISGDDRPTYTGLHAVGRPTPHMQVHMLSIEVDSLLIWRDPACTLEDRKDDTFLHILGCLGDTVSPKNTVPVAQAW